MGKHLRTAAETYLLAVSGAFIFHLLNIPLAWIIGSMTAVMIWKSVARREIFSAQPVKNTAFIILGALFGLFFTASTFQNVVPYIIPFLLITIALVLISIGIGLSLSKIAKIDPVSSVFGSVPGGLTEMVAASESLRANTAMVALMQTVRLLTVVFLVPFIVVHLFAADSAAIPEAATAAGEMTRAVDNETVPLFHYGWYGVAAMVGWLLRSILPAAYVIGPMMATGLMNIAGVPLPEVPSILLIWAQITVGINMGRAFSVEDLKRGGKMVGLLAFTTVLLISLSFMLGYMLSLFTVLPLTTAILSVAPGGLVEMALTAVAVGADPSVVTSLQMVRVLFIIMFVPGLIKLWFTINR
jgi:membrane AbrB-like protein